MQNNDRPVENHLPGLCAIAEALKKQPDRESQLLAATVFSIVGSAHAGGAWLEIQYRHATDVATAFVTLPKPTQDN